MPKNRKLVVAAKGTNDVFIAASPAGIVRQMKRSQWNAPTKKSEYMDEVRHRVQQMTGAMIETQTPRDFLLGLEQVGLVTVVWDALLH